MSQSFSDQYRLDFAQAMADSLELSFPNKIGISAGVSVSDDELKKLREFFSKPVFHILNVKYSLFPYWGAMCLPLSSTIFAILKAKGFNADIVYGEVEINGTDEFDSNVEEMKLEYIQKKKHGVQNLHAWVSIGDDIIIDAALPDRISKYYEVPDGYIPDLFIYRAWEMDEHFKSKYKPMLVGSDFIAGTNTQDPLDEVREMSIVLPNFIKHSEFL